MVASPLPEPRTQPATFSYFNFLPRHEIEKPYEILIDLPEEAKHVPRSNFAFADAECLVHDVRGREQEFSLDTHGFTWRKFGTSVRDFGDRSQIEGIYLGEIVEFLRQELGEDLRKIQVFDWRVRSWSSFLCSSALGSGERMFLKELYNAETQHS